MPILTNECIDNLKKINWTAFFKRTAILWVFFILTAVVAIMYPVFLSPTNLMNVVKQISINGILAVGLTYVLISGGIDLSVGATVAVSSVFVAYFVGETSTYPMIIPFIVALLTGGAVGFINGFSVAYANIPPFIITLSTMISVRGFAMLITDGEPIFHLSKGFTDVANGFSLGLPNLTYFLTFVLAAGLFVLSRTVFGKWVYAIGGNETAARLSGIDVRRTKVAIYVISGVLAGLCGLLMASRITSGNPTVAVGYELNAIAACVIGGVSLTGGSGAISGTIVGALIIGVLQNALDIMGVSPFWQDIMQGLIISVAVFLDVKTQTKKT